MSNTKLLVTGAAGMVGACAVRRAIEEGCDVRAMVRPSSDKTLLQDLRVELVDADMTDPDSLVKAVKGADIVVHAAAHIGDWGPRDRFRAVNVIGLEYLLNAVEREGRLRRWIQISTLGVYPARDHYGTDETVPASLAGLDGYTYTKAEAEELLKRHIDEYKLPAVILRPGFIYGAGERHVIPRLIERFESGTMKFIGDGKKLLNNTYVGNLVDAIFLALEKDEAVGEIFNIRDERLVTREEYIMSVAEYLRKPRPGTVPLWLARAAVTPIEGFARLFGSKKAPPLTKARIKFMTLNLDFSIDKAKRILGYEPRVDFQDGIKKALDWATRGSS